MRWQVIRYKVDALEDILQRSEKDVSRAKHHFKRILDEILTELNAPKPSPMIVVRQKYTYKSCGYNLPGSSSHWYHRVKYSLRPGHPWPDANLIIDLSVPGDNLLVIAMTRRGIHGYCTVDDRLCMAISSKNNKVRME